MKQTFSPKRKLGKLLLPFILVVMPLTVSGIYLYNVAEDRYVSQTVMVVKQIDDRSASMATVGLGALLGASSTSVEDAYFLKEYIQSYDMFVKLDKQLNLRKHFVGNQRDWFFRLAPDASHEETLLYYQKRISLHIDEKLTILELTVEGFDPETAYQINRVVIEESERFINELSRQLAREQLKFSEEQLAHALERLRQSREALLNYQNNNSMLDPTANAVSINQLIATLRVNLAELQTQERTLLSYLNPDTPQVIALRSQIAAVQQQISSEGAKLTSTQGGTRLNRQAVQFETLKADAEYSADIYKIALSAFERARIETSRKMKSLVLLTSPQLPDEALYPRRIYILFSIFLIALLVYGFIQLTFSVIREHRD